jgi:hypothetical protein
MPDAYLRLAQRPFVLAIVEHWLVDICHLLGAERFEVLLTQVTFFKRRSPTEVTYWSAVLGDSIRASGQTWRVIPAVKVGTAPVSVG